MNNSETEILRKRKILKPAHVIVIGFLTVILLGSCLLTLPISNKDGNWLSYINALFTSASAVCVTGLIAVPTAVSFNYFGQVVVLILIQIGGLGFMTLATMLFLVFKKRIKLKDRIVLQEALNQDNNKGVVKLTRNIIFLTLIIEGIGAALLMPVFIFMNGPIGIYQAIFTAVSAFCNAGFDIFGTVAAPYQGMIQFVNNGIVSLTICFLIILGGLGFTVIMDIGKNRRFKKFSLHTKIVLIFSSILILLGAVCFFAAEFNNDKTMGNLNVGSKILASFFQSITSRTAGFNTVDQASLSPASKLISMVLMFIGASPASTGGGIKTTTFAILLLMLVAGIRNKDEVVMGKRTITTKNCLKAVSIVLFSLAAVVTVTLILFVSERHNAVLINSGMYTLDNFLFEAFSAFGTVGLSTGITPYLSPIGKIALMCLMFFGRVGTITIELLFIAKKNNDLSIKYPDGSVMIG